MSIGHEGLREAAIAASSATDGELIAASVADGEQFSMLFRRHGAHVHRYLARRLGRDLADDLTAEVFLAAFGKRARYTAELPTALPWLYGIAGYVVAQHRRDEARRWRLLAAIAPDLPHASHADDADARVTAWGSRAALVEGLLLLHSRDREVLLMVAWEQLSAVEAAAALGIPAGTARTRLHRARHRLQAHLSEDAGAVSGEASLEELLRHE